MSIHKSILRKYLKSRKIHTEDDWELTQVKYICALHAIDWEKILKSHSDNRKLNKNGTH
jgi:hypothetical protein